MADGTISTGQAAVLTKHMVGHGFSRHSIVRLIEAGYFVGQKQEKNGRWRIDRASLLTYLEKVRQRAFN